MDRRRQAILGCVVGAMLLTIVASGAVTLEPDGADTVFDETDDIVAEPHPGPGGEYAFVNEDGEFAVLLSEANSEVEGEGANLEAVTEITDVLRFTYAPEDEGDTVTLWLEHTDEAAAEIVEFRADGDSIEGESNSVTLEAGQSVDVGFEVDLRDVETADPVIDSVEINAIGPEATDDGAGTAASGSSGSSDGSDDDTSVSDDDGEPTASPAGSDDGDTESAGSGGLEEEEIESLFELGGFAGALGAMVLLLLLILLLILLRQAQRHYSES